MGHEHDHGCKHCHEHEHGHEHKHGQGENGFAVPLVRLVLVVILTAAAWIAPLETLPWYVRLIAFLVPYLIAGYDVLLEAGENILHGEIFDECFLMSLATIGAFVIGEYPEAVAVMLFYQIGEFFQDLAVDRTRDSIAELMNIRPDHADVKRGDKLIRVLPNEVKEGEIIVVRPGERFPLDGTIVEGATSVDASALTGESIPRDVAVGDGVYSGSVNMTGVVEVRVTGTYEQSTAAKILDMVENSAEKKSRSEAFITRFAKIYTPAVVGGAALLFLVPSIITGDWSGWLRRALIFLVVSCPCALVISVPLSFFGGIGGASHKGILIKGSNYVEALAKLETVVFDKTGTLTEGSFRVTDVHPDVITEGELLDIAAAAESYSNHPIAESIIEAHGGHIDRERIGEVTELPGRGLRAVIDGKVVYVGNAKLMDECRASHHDCGETGTIIHVAYEGEYLGHIVISDKIKANSASAVAELKNAGVKKTVMLTGDVEKVGKAVAAEAGVDECYCELLPGDKVSKLEELLEAKESGTLAFVGDGINDAPALTRSDVGIAMGALGSDAAIEAADVVLMNDDPAKIPEAVKRSKKTIGIVKQNIAFALIAKAAVLILGALGIANMWLAVFADVGVALICVVNAMRALK
ncbi:MAG: cadmium-translocating P-type ATPase [Clostridia bacterium]|nr:cadmium-translocating P-type ATPase [Clostridia bacterium]